MGRRVGSWAIFTRMSRTPSPVTCVVVVTLGIIFHDPKDSSTGAPPSLRIISTNVEFLPPAPRGSWLNIFITERCVSRQPQIFSSSVSWWPPKQPAMHRPIVPGTDVMLMFCCVHEAVVAAGGQHRGQGDYHRDRRGSTSPLPLHDDWIRSILNACVIVLVCELKKHRVE